MDGLLKALVPQGKKALALWLVLFVSFFGFYYFGGPYSAFDRWYEDVMHFEEDVPLDSGDNSTLVTPVKQIKAQEVAADFMESRVVVTLQNLTEEAQSAVVGLNLDLPADSDTRYYIQAPLEERSQNTVILRDIPPRAEVDAVFAVRIADGEPGRSYKLNFYVNGEFAHNTVHAVTYDRLQTLRMWLVSLFLLPPGSHILIPVLSMLLVAWMESLTSHLKKNPSQKDIAESMWSHLRQHQWRQIMGLMWPDVLLFLIFMIVLSGLILGVLPKLWIRFPVLAVFWMATAICFAPAVYNWLGRNEEDDAKGQKPKEDKSGTGSSQEEESKEDNDAA